MKNENLHHTINYNFKVTQLTKMVEKLKNRIMLIIALKCLRKKNEALNKRKAEVEDVKINIIKVKAMNDEIYFHDRDIVYKKGSTWENSRRISIDPSKLKDFFILTYGYIVIRSTSVHLYNNEYIETCEKRYTQEIKTCFIINNMLFVVFREWVNVVIINSKIVHKYR
jgi:hypothetical protein